MEQNKVACGCVMALGVFLLVGGVAYCALNYLAGSWDVGAETVRRGVISGAGTALVGVVLIFLAGIRLWNRKR